MLISSFLTIYCHIIYILLYLSLSLCFSHTTLQLFSPEKAYPGIIQHHFPNSVQHLTLILLFCHSQHCFTYIQSGSSTFTTCPIHMPLISSQPSSISVNPLASQFRIPINFLQNLPRTLCNSYHASLNPHIFGWNAISYTSYTACLFIPYFYIGSHWYIFVHSYDSSTSFSFGYSCLFSPQLLCFPTWLLDNSIYQLPLYSSYSFSISRLSFLFSWKHHFLCAQITFHIPVFTIFIYYVYFLS